MLTLNAVGRKVLPVYKDLKIDLSAIGYAIYIIIMILTWCFFPWEFGNGAPRYIGELLFIWIVKFLASLFWPLLWFGWFLARPL